MVKQENNKGQDELFPMFVVANEIIGMDSGVDAWNYDGESGVLIPFQPDGETLFQEHFN